jgi:hypothetical protein
VNKFLVQIKEFERAQLHFQDVTLNLPDNAIQAGLFQGLILWKVINMLDAETSLPCRRQIQHDGFS